MVKTKIIAEIGINFAFGSDKSKFLDNAKKLIDIAVIANCDYVKFQKRNPDTCVPNSQKNILKLVPWEEKEITYLEYKKAIEFGREEYDEIDKYCKAKGIIWFASVWDLDSVDFIKTYNVGKSILKIPSALITNFNLINCARSNSDILILSTGMSTEVDIFAAIVNGKPNVVFHTNSTYPAPIEDLNLDYIRWLTDKFGSKCEIGYSGHEFGLMTTIAATLLGATWIERHITLDRTNWGSDQLASVEPQGLIKLVKSIRDIEKARGGYCERKIFDSELQKLKTLRG